MTKAEIKYIFNKVGITLPDSGETEILDLSDVISYFVISKKARFRDKKYKRFVLDMDNNLLINLRLNLNGDYISDKGSNIARENIYKFENINSIHPYFGG